MGITEFFKSIPLWIYILIFGTLAIYIWWKLPYLLKLQLKKVISSKVFIPIIFFAAWWWWHSKDIIIDLNQSTFWMPMIALGILVIVNAMGNLRYHSKQVITPNFHGSYTKVLNVNGFVILNIGGFDAFGVSIPMAQEILVVREETFAQMEQSSFGLVRVAPASFDYELDPDVKKEIEGHIFLKHKKNNILYGWFEDINRVDWTEEELKNLEEGKTQDDIYAFLKKELKIDNPSIVDLYRRYRNICADYNKLNENYVRIIKGEDRLADFSKRQREVWGDKKERREIPEGYEET